MVGPAGGGGVTWDEAGTGLLVEPLGVPGLRHLHGDGTGDPPRGEISRAVEWGRWEGHPSLSGLGTKIL